MTLAATGPAAAGYVTRETCRACGAGPLQTVLAYGEMPLAGGFLRPDEVAREQRFPLTLVRCPGCSLAQVAESISSEILFSDYRYLASVPLGRHFAAYADHVPAVIGLRPDDLVIEAGCNDGVLLRPLRERGFRRLLGVDPADNVTAHVPEGIPVRSAFFEPEVARAIAAEHGAARLVAANNVFAHMDDPGLFAEAAATLLAPDGSFVFEVHYLLDLLETFQFDTVYHEHVLYWSLTALGPLLASRGLRLWHVERIPNHGGSIRAYACRADAPMEGSADLAGLLLLENEMGVAGDDLYAGFAAGVHRRVAALDGLLDGYAEQGVRIAAYGAAGRATVLFNFAAATRRHVAYVVDESPERIGRLMPGAHTPIVGPERLDEDPPDLVLLSAWSYADVLREKVLARLPGREPAFCVPLPEPRVLPA